MKYLVTISVLLFSISLVTKAQSERKNIRKGNRDYEKGDYQDAEVQYRKALDKSPGSTKADYNLAGSLYKQKKYEAAASKYLSTLDKVKNKTDMARYYYNLGNSMVENKKIEQGIEAYKQSLINNPSDADAKHNLALAERMLAQQKKQQQQNKNQKNNQQNNKNQQNKNQQNKQNQQNKNNNQNQQQQQQQQQNDQKNQQQQQQAQISKKDAERLLQAMERQEKDVMKKVEKEKAQSAKVRVEKNW